MSQSISFNACNFDFIALVISCFCLVHDVIERLSFIGGYEYRDQAFLLRHCFGIGTTFYKVDKV